MKTKSTRRPCPININCELVAAERGKVCPNRSFCEHLAAPWNLPYTLDILSDGTRVLTVDYRLPSPFRLEYNAAGWYRAFPLPFFYAERPEYSKPALTVALDSLRDTSKLREFGWENAVDLSDDFYMSSWLYTVEEAKSVYPHCILPPNF